MQYQKKKRLETIGSVLKGVMILVLILIFNRLVYIQLNSVKNKTKILMCIKNLFEKPCY